MRISDITVDDDGAVRRITLDRADKRNAMTIPMFDAVADAIDGAVADDAIRVVVIRGAGDHFCSGAEIGTAAPATPVPVPVPTLVRNGRGPDTCSGTPRVTSPHGACVVRGRDPRRHRRAGVRRRHRDGARPGG